MTRKDYIIIADMIGDLAKHNHLDTEDEEVMALVDMKLEKTNANYDPVKFWRAVSAKKTSK